MILLCFVDLFLSNKHLTKNLDDNEYQTNNDIKQLIIIIGLVTIIYLILHQVNQTGDFEFKLYNKLMFVVMLIDIVISMFFLSKLIINNSMNNLEVPN